MGWDTRKAQERGIDVNQVFESYARHLSNDRRKVRDNPKLLDTLKPADRYSLAVTQESTATGVRWRSLGGLPAGVDDITVTGSSFEAARNRCTLHELMEMRYRRELASALQRAGLYQADLAGRRAAMAVALASSISVADLVGV